MIRPAPAALEQAPVPAAPAAPCEDEPLTPAEVRFLDWLVEQAIDEWRRQAS